jgi:hypothetical protein
MDGLFGDRRKTMNSTREATERKSESVSAFPVPQASPSESLGRALRRSWPEWSALLAYTTVIAVAIPRHEPFVDEAQAWQLARSLPLTDLFRTYLRYEGSPGLWHLLLWLLAHAGIGYSGMHWVCGGIAVASSALLLFFSPFPRVMKLALPFGYFLIFQYAVVARSYLLAPPLLFLIAICWKRHSTWVAVLLGLLANTSLHAAMISGGLAIVYLIEQIKGGVVQDRSRRGNLVAFSAIIASLYSFAIWTAWPPPDLTFMKYTREGRPAFFVGAFVSLVIGICQPAICSMLTWAAMVFILARRRCLRFLLPALFFSAFSAIGTFSWWHFGLVTPLLITILWITWDQSSARITRYDWIAFAPISYAVVVQILWAAHALAYDYREPYSPDRAGAEFLRPLVEAKATILSTSLRKHIETEAFLSVGIQPYFDHNIFANQERPFWWWSDRNQSENEFERLLSNHPRAVLLEADGAEGKLANTKSERSDELLRYGYALSHMFCGSIPVRFEVSTTSCHLVYEPATQRPAM